MKLNYLFKRSRFQAFSIYIYIYTRNLLFRWTSMLGALIKLTFEQTAVEFEWQKASFCGDCKLHSNYDCTAAENLRACMLRFASPIGFQILIRSHWDGLSAVVVSNIIIYFIEFRENFWQNLDFTTRDCKKFCVNSLGEIDR